MVDFMFRSTDSGSGSEMHLAIQSPVEMTILHFNSGASPPNKYATIKELLPLFSLHEHIDRPVAKGYR